MAYIFLTTSDLKSHILEQYLTERSEETPQIILESLELQNIELIKSKLKGRFDTEEIFNETGTDRHWLIIKILVKLVLYDFIRRNAARKVPTDYREEWEWAMKLLEKIKAGKEVPDGLPVFIDTEGNSGRAVIGNNKNSDIYI